MTKIRPAAWLVAIVRASARAAGAVLMSAALMSGLFASAVLASGCAGTHRAVRTRADAAIEVDCPVDDARVYVDERFIGRARELRGKSIAVVAGAQRVEVRADGWFTAYREVPVAKDARARVEVPLRRVPEGESAE